MTRIPREKAWDSTLALLSDGYTFISERCRRHGSDLFETRLMLQPVFCMLGEEAARVFYEPDRFTRVGAMPKPTVRLLQDRGSVQLLDGEAHRWRKTMFMSLMTPPAIQRLADLTEEEWRKGIGRWTNRGKIVLLHEAHEVLCRAVCRWAGLTLTDGEATRRTREFAAMIDGAGAIGPRNWWGMGLRARSERWCRQVVENVRIGALQPAEGSAAHVISWHEDLDGKLLHGNIAAVELINVLRPTVAIGHSVTSGAIALHQHPECRQRLQESNGQYLELFVQEVRRFYPFFPCIGGRVRNAFTWRGHHFTEGTWVLLDLYGTNHGPRIWQDPETFRPERFLRWGANAFDFIPQGGGDHYLGYRCPGEWITIELMKRAMRRLTTSMRYEVPEQDLRIDLSRMPALPSSRFVIAGVRPAD
jgi:fatty-acid peroxygenase